MSMHLDVLETGSRLFVLFVADRSAFAVCLTGAR